MDFTKLGFKGTFWPIYLPWILWLIIFILILSVRERILLKYFPNLWMLLPVTVMILIRSFTSIPFHDSMSYLLFMCTYVPFSLIFRWEIKQSDFLFIFTSTLTSHGHCIKTKGIFSYLLNRGIIQYMYNNWRVSCKFSHKRNIKLWDTGRKKDDNLISQHFYYYWIRKVNYVNI